MPVRLLRYSRSNGFGLSGEQGALEDFKAIALEVDAAGRPKCQVKHLVDMRLTHHITFSTTEFLYICF